MNKTTNIKPKSNQKVRWLMNDGSNVDGIYYCGLWFLGDKLEMYVYYTPEYWEPRS